MSEQFLYVELIVPVSQARQFEQASKPFSRNFDELRKPSGFTLKLALKGQAPFTYTPYGRFGRLQALDVLPTRANAYGDSEIGRKRQVYRYVHLWEVEDGKDGDLVTLMELAGDNDKFMAVEAAVIRETQEFVRLVKTRDGLPPLNGGKLFIRRTRRFAAQDVSAYLFDLGTVIPTLEASGWRSLGQFQNITGLLNRVTEFWQVSPSSPTMARALTQPTPLVQRLISATPKALSQVQETFMLAPYFNPTAG